MKIKQILLVVALSSIGFSATAMLTKEQVNKQWRGTYQWYTSGSFGSKYEVKRNCRLERTKAFCNNLRYYLK